MTVSAWVTPAPAPDECRTVSKNISHKQYIVASLCKRQTAGPCGWWVRLALTTRVQTKGGHLSPVSGQRLTFGEPTGLDKRLVQLHLSQIRL